MKKTTLLFALCVFLSGCVRETYLQQVPCNDCSCKPQGCPEIEMQTVVETFAVYDVPAPRTMYTGCDTRVRRCRQVCREIWVEQ